MYVFCIFICITFLFPFYVLVRYRWMKQIHSLSRGGSVTVKERSKTNLPAGFMGDCWLLALPSSRRTHWVFRRRRNSCKSHLNLWYTSDFFCTSALCLNETFGNKHVSLWFSNQPCHSEVFFLCRSSWWKQLYPFTLKWLDPPVLTLFTSAVQTSREAENQTARPGPDGRGGSERLLPVFYWAVAASGWRAATHTSDRTALNM